MSNTPSDEELIAELEAAGVAFMAFRGGARLTKKIWTTSGSQDAKKIATGIRAVLAKWGAPQPVVREPQCWCLTCKPMLIDDPSSIRMALCPTCGNKRCPKANDHRNQCSNSNEPGQKGSAYEGCGITQKGGQHGADN